MENTITIDLKSKGFGKYDAYISTEGSSGAHYPFSTASEIADYTADLIDCLEEADSGRTYLEFKQNTYLLISTDGYDIESTEYPTLSAAKEAMTKAYAMHYPEDNDDSFAELSACGETDAILYANGESVYVWHIVTVKTYDNSYYLLHNTSSKTFIYKVGSSMLDAYNKLRGYAMLKAARNNRTDIERISFKKDSLSGFIQYSDMTETFKIVSSKEIQHLLHVHDEDLVDGDSIPEDLDLDHEGALYAVFDIGRE